MPKGSRAEGLWRAFAEHLPGGEHDAVKVFENLIMFSDDVHFHRPEGDEDVPFLEIRANRRDWERLLKYCEDELNAKRTPSYRSVQMDRLLAILEVGGIE